MTDASGTRQPPTWVLDELATAGHENLDELHVAQYDEKEDSRAADDVALLRRWGLDSDSVVVDLGAGTGQFALAVAPHCARVFAVDISPAMLEHLRAKVSRSGLVNIEIVDAGFLTYDHAGPPPDVVYSRWALHHLSDFWKTLALRRIREMLNPGAVLRLSDIVFSFEPHEAEHRIDTWCASLPDAPQNEGDWVRADIEDHIRDEHSTFTWLLEPMIERAGFSIDQAHYSDDGFYADYLARAT